ncbi:hypothetical protein CONLIGDRAFT_431206 [Coniochaeta ligniaria NRRL 30616]|uniref:Uncharacterized protein n=1 Tax=Coniochaeta ligniaria NRRL 30616 TaxID=1408157 RepID=A0A1J7JIK6_9PEZI|nr:hypothetical protein CONLIGDRAFT_431206 [Coniochaeta ligniaria NRRL 30616]
MEDKMDGVAEVAKKACLVAERVLPGRPHHLTLVPNRKYAPPSGFWFTGTSSRLQYLTNLSDADRGMLLTVPYFEIMNEPEAANPVKTVQKGEAKKKLSMKDYKARKKSTSPTDNDLSVKADMKQGDAAVDATAPNDKDKSRESRPKETNGHPVAKSEMARPDQDRERTTTQSKSEAKNPQTQDTRKRPPDANDSNPPGKKLKTGDGALRSDVAGDPRSGTHRSREGPKDKPTLREPREAREMKAITPSGAANGRLQVSSDKDRDLSSPRSTIMVNGARSRAGSSTSTPRKGDRGDALRANIPPLLSPPFQMDIGEEILSPRKKPAGKAPLKGPKTTSHSRTGSATKPPIPDLLSPIHLDLDDDHVSPGKKLQEKSKAKVSASSNTSKRPKLPIPPLLSPTLPPIVEEDLKRNPPPKAIPISQATSMAKKTKPALEPKTRPEDSSVRSKIVVLKYKRALKTRVQAILSLPSKSRREALRKERSASVERTPPARKRPLPAAEAASEAPSKRSRPSADALPFKPAAPTTPLKNSATSMIRVLSNTSQANTPGDSTHLTPGATERPPTSSENLDPAILARSAAYRERHVKHTKLGSKLKHTKDAIVRDRPPTSISDSENKRAAALHFEMVLSYMVAFKAYNQSRLLERKPIDVGVWETLLPHFQELRSRTHRSRPLQALTMQIHALCLEEYCQAFTSLDEKLAGAVYGRWVRYAKKRREVWEEAHALVDKVDEGKMKVNLGPWTSVDDAVAEALLVIRRWAASEGVDWKSELDVPRS